MTFFVFHVAGILHSSGNLSYLSGRRGLSSGKMKFLVQFAIRCECKRPLPLLTIEKREGQIDGHEVREIERGNRKSEARGRNVSGDRMSYVTLAIARSPFSPFFRRLVSTALAAKFDISRAIKSNLLRKRSIPLARVISMAPTSDRRAWESEQTIPSILNVHATSMDFISSVSYSFRSLLILVIENNVNIRTRDSARDWRPWPVSTSKKLDLLFLHALL